MTTIRTTASSLHLRDKSMQTAFLSEPSDDCDETGTCTKSCLAVPRQCVKQFQQCRQWFHGKQNKLQNAPEIAVMDQYDTVAPVKSTQSAPTTPCTTSSTSGSSTESNSKTIKSTRNYETMIDNGYTPTSQLFGNKCVAIPSDSAAIKEVREKDKSAQSFSPTLLTSPSGTNVGLTGGGRSTIQQMSPTTLFLQIDSSHSSLNVPSILIPRHYERVNVDDLESIQTLDSMSTVTMDPAIRNAYGSLASDPSETSLSLSSSSYQRQHQHQKVTSLLIRGKSYAFDHTIYTTDSSIWYSGGGGYNQQHSQSSKKSLQKKKTNGTEYSLETNTTASNTKSTNLPPLSPTKRKTKVGHKCIVNTTAAYQQEPSVSPIAPRLLVEI
jgi:hypothetical protein